MLELAQFLADLKTFVGFKTVVCTNKEEFRKARHWIKAFFDPEHTAFLEREYSGGQLRPIYGGADHRCQIRDEHHARPAEQQRTG